MATGLIGLLEAEFRQLSQDARKGEGITSWLSSSDYPEVKEAAERAVLKVRSFADSPDALEQIRHSKEILKPLLLACDTKSNKLVSHALSTAQKLLANGALSQEGAVAVGGMLAKVEKSSDETVQLKILQTALTLLQSPWHPTGMDDIGAVLGVCFRMLSSKGHKDTVVSTATATVRQAVALVFSYVDVDAELARIDRVVARQQQGSPPTAQQLQPGQDAQAEQQPASASTEAAALSAESSSSVAEVPAVEQSSSSSTAGSGAAPGSVQAEAPAAAGPGQDGSGLAEVIVGRSKEAGLAVADDLAAPTVQAAHKLLEDLCAIATGAPPQWLKTPSLPRTFVLEILDFVLTNSAAIFRSLPAFENTLSVWISQILMSQLQDHLDAGAAGSAMAVNSFSTFRAVLRTSRTVLRGFYPQIGMRCGSMVQGLLRGLSPKIPLFQRIAVMQVLKQLMGDACFVYFLFSAYDMQPELHFEIVQATVQSCTDIVEGTVKAANNKDPEDDPPLELVMGMCHARAQGKDWTMDTDFEVAQVPVQSAYLSLLALDTLMAFMGSVEKLTDFLVLDGGSVPEAARRFPTGGVETVDLDTCRAMVGRNWRKILSVFRELLLQCNGEDMIVMLLKGYQVFTQACGQLEMLEPRDAFLGTLCEFALSSSAALGNGESPSAASGRLASPRGADPESGLVLSPKNVQSMRALFNIAHRLSNVLGPAWTLVLETMYTLDTILHSPHTTTQEVSNSSGEQPMCSDVAILSAAASQMFECTSSMSREAVVSLLSGLRDVSVRHIPQAVQVQQPKLFALNRMVEVLLYNKSRIYDLWAIFLSHVLELASDSKVPVRAAAIEALDRAIVGTLGSPRHAVRRTGDETGSPRDDSGGVEYMLLVAMESLYSGNTERDVQSGVLRVLLNVLQRHGEHLSEGWTPVFRLLACVPSQKDAERIDLAFQSVQLTCSDYMAAMPYARMKRSLEVAAMYGSQQVDLNVSLTAISLLWNSADMLGRQGAGSSSNSLRQLGPRLGTNSDDEAGQDDTVEADGPAAGEVSEPRAAPDVPMVRGEPGSKPPAPQFSAAQTEELLQLIFVALQCLAMDLRPEVRNSGVRTLFAVIVNQGPRLSLELWERCLWEMLFPLLRHAYRMSANSDKEEAEAQLLGSTRGKEVRLMVHHSRNSEQKQWDETVVIALGGMGRLLKAHLPAVVQLEAFPAAWEELMVVVESSMAGGRKEVALAAIMLLGGVLQAHAGPPPLQHDSVAGGPSSYGVSAVTDVMWKRAMRALDVGVEAATTPTCQVPLQARIELVNLLGSSFTMLKERFDEEDTRQVYFWLERFCKNPWSDDDAANTVQVAMGLPPVQKAVLALLPSLGPAHLPQLWPELIFSLVRFLKPNQVLDNWRRQRAEQQQCAAAAAALAAQQLQQQQEAAALQSAQQGQQQQHSQAKSQRHGVPTGTGMAPQLGGGSAGEQQATQAAASGQEGTEAAPPVRPSQQQPLATPKHALSSVFLEKVLEALVSMYQGVAPVEAKAVTFPAVVTALGRCMEVRYVAFSEPLWRQAAHTFITIISAGLPAVAAAHAVAEAQPGHGGLGSSSGTGVLPQNPAAMGQAAPEGAWEALAAAFEGFLLGAHSFGQSEQPTGQPGDQGGEGQGMANGSLTMGGLSEDPGMLLASRRQPSQQHQQLLRQASAAAQEGGVLANGGQAAVTSAAEPPLDPAQCRADAELEVAVLDTLADVVLTAAGSASRAMKLRLVRAVDGGISRPTEINIRQVSTGANFSHVCLRKLYVLCSRGGASLGAASAFLPDEQVAACLLEVAQLALPVLLARCETMLRAFWEGSLLRSVSASPMPSPGNPSSATDLQQLQQQRDRVVQSGKSAGAGPAGVPRLDEVMCVLEVLASMSLAQQVVDAALAGNDHMRQMVALLRSRPEVSARGRERTHLLLLYPLLCEGITCKEARVREMVKDVLQLAGAELGLGTAGLGGSGVAAGRVGAAAAAGGAAVGSAVEEAVVVAGKAPETAAAAVVEVGSGG